MCVTFKKVQMLKSENTGQGDVLKGTNGFQKSLIVSPCFASLLLSPLILESLWLKQGVSNFATVFFQVSMERFHDSPWLWRREAWSHSGYKTIASELIRKVSERAVPGSSDVIRSNSNGYINSLILTKLKFQRKTFFFPAFFHWANFASVSFSIFHYSSFLLLKK